LPIGAAIERVAKGADFTLVSRTGVEIHSRRQRAGQQEGAIHRRQLALPGATAGLHVEKMIVKPLVAGGVGLGALRALPEKTQRRKRSLHRGGPRHEAALYPDRIRRQRKAGGGDARGPIRRGLVDHEAVGRIRLMQKISECFALQLFQFGIDGQFHATLRKASSTTACASSSTRRK
jgi:hypothetical protein